MDSSEDILSSTENSIERWMHSLHYYQDQAIERRSSASGPRMKICFHCAIDISYSMEGTRLLSVKNGLCAVVAGLADDDLINISSFSESIRSITNGFQPVSSVRELLPSYLNALDAEGSTALYDATVDGIKKLRETFESHRAGEDFKYALLVLTDGEDTASQRDNESVLRYLAAPGVSRFMFVLIAVEMEQRQEQLLESWVSMRHCKQISVNIRSGKKLVQIFGEALMDRIITSDPEGQRFYNCPEGTVPHEDSLEDIRASRQWSRGRSFSRPSSPVHLSADLLRTLGDHSPNISRANSVTGSDMGDDIDDNESIDGGHGRIINDPTAYYSLSSPVYRPSSPIYSSSPTLSFTPPRPPQSDFNSFVSTYQNPTVFRVPGPNNVINPAAPQCVLDKDGNRIIGTHMEPFYKKEKKRN